MATPKEARTEGRTDEGKTPAEIGAGAQKEPMTKKKVDSKKKEMASKMGKGMPYSMSTSTEFRDGPGQRAKQSTGSTSFSTNGMPYSMSADRKFSQEKLGKEKQRDF